MSVLFNFVGNGIKIWLRSKCESIKELDLQIFGSNNDFLKGEINKVYIKAKDVKYKNLPLSFVELNSGRIKFILNPVSIGNALYIDKDFVYKGSISITSKDINDIFRSHNWAWLKNWFSKEVLHGDILEDIEIVDSIVEISGKKASKSSKIKRKFCLYSEHGKLIIKSKDLGKEEAIIFPIDPLITIQDVIINRLELTFIISGVVRP